MARRKHIKSSNYSALTEATEATYFPSVWFSVTVGLLLRLILMFYGLYQDSTMAVKYTDVDYFVFTDAAEFVTKGESPYNRSTYRYTPILAWMLQPNHWITPLFGKVVFILCDVLAGYLMYVILNLKSNKKSTALVCAEFWLFNPLPVTVSSRGNAESIMAVLVLGTLYYLIKDGAGKSHRHVTVSGALYGLSVHTKIYPVIYALPIYLFMNENYTGDTRKKTWRQRLNSMSRCDVAPNTARVNFVLTAGVVFLLLSVVCFQWCGEEFLQETYLYHITRRDTRHNFSPYFYMLYLTGGDGRSSLLLGLTAFIPQVALLVLLSFTFHEDLPFCCFLQTFVFVAFNKVCTSQYFLWYLSLLPLVTPRLDLSGREGLCLVVMWFIGQGVWLAPAYYLEFEGQNTFGLIWIAGLNFFLINIWIIQRLIQTYNFAPLFHKGNRTAQDLKEWKSTGQFLVEYWSWQQDSKDSIYVKKRK